MLHSHNPRSIVSVSNSISQILHFTAISIVLPNFKHLHKLLFPFSCQRIGSHFSVAGVAAFCKLVITPLRLYALCIAHTSYKTFHTRPGFRAAIRSLNICFLRHQTDHRNLSSAHVLQFVRARRLSFIGGEDRALGTFSTFLSQDTRHHSTRHPLMSKLTFFILGDW